MFSACLISHAYPFSLSLSYRPRSRCPLLSAQSVCQRRQESRPGKKRQTDERERMETESNEARGKRRRERYEDRCIYRERERVKRDFFSSLMSLLAVHPGSSSLLLESRETRANVLHVHFFILSLTLCQIVLVHFNFPLHLCGDVR